MLLRIILSHCVVWDFVVIQFGFVTLFVAAFSLAPLFALLNNLVELRLDVYNFVCNERRVTSKRVQDIGAWSGILKAVTYIAVICNAFVIAYTTDFIPRMVYQLSHSSNKSLVGFVDASLSGFMGNIPPTCRYPGYREPPNSQNPYGYSEFYWHILAARLIFVVVFEAQFDTEKKKFQAQKMEKDAGLPPAQGVSSPLSARSLRSPSPILVLPEEVENASRTSLQPPRY
ncbi:unnamed protein product [Darwinula stevensoni]|uniref:Anoctamin n=1 Tax=Darwinula stevensoni TaxID=69355 RepID=A0A7R9A663_9CRUS|nr:unnamed protein product [Darwinula stevensoni]CAG0886849.1 unnamed protein product [Darwinula stevensoni]